METHRIIFAGSGGQGLITAGVMLAEAAVLYENLNAVQSELYGAEARGGLSRSDVIISDGEIHFPKVLEANVLVCLTQKAYQKYSDLVRPGGLLLTDRFYVKQDKEIDVKQIELDMHRQVINIIGKPIVFNVCMLGAFIRLTRLVRAKSVMKVLEKRVPSGFLDINKQALVLGMQIAEDLEKDLDR